MGSLKTADRIFVTYRIAGAEKEALACAKDICIEQTVEFPGELISSRFIRDNIVAKIESFTPHESGGFKAVISYAQEIAAAELTQLLNLIFGHVSMKTGIRVCDVVLPNSCLTAFKGPRFGREGLRQLLNVSGRPLLGTSLKPMGLSAGQLADLAYQCVLGGIDIIKDDHSLTNQCFAPFEERVRLCCEAVDKANRETNQRCVYVANITAPLNEILRRARFARESGAGGVMVAPGIVGFDTMRFIADNDSFGLAVFSHPAMQGSYLINSDAGISHYVIFGIFNRLCGADAVIYPNYGGRFHFDRNDCEEIIRGTSFEMGHIKTIFPMPGGGISLERIPELVNLYGRDAIFLVGAGLFTHGPDFVENCRYLRRVVDERFK